MTAALLFSRKDICKKLLVLLAQVTYAANNFPQRTVVDGVPKTITIRDSTGMQCRTQGNKRNKASERSAAAANGDVPHSLSCTYVNKVCNDPFRTRPRRRRVLKRAALKRKINAAREAKSAACMAANLHSRHRFFTTLPPGRLAAVLERIRLRIREAQQAQALALNCDYSWPGCP